jgi:hypothetical protein
VTLRPLPEVLVWLDPGKLTGWAMLEHGESFLSGQGDFAEVDDLVNTWVFNLGSHLWLGWEMYVVTGGGGRFGSPEYSLEMIGAVKSACRRYRVTTLPPQPSAARKLGDDDKLRRLGWYRPGQRHANDAANHLLAYLLRENLLPPAQTERLFTSG